MLSVRGLNAGLEFLGMVGGLLSGAWQLSVELFGVAWSVGMLGLAVGVVVYAGRTYGPAAAVLVLGRLTIALPIGASYSYLIGSLMAYSLAAGAWNEVVGSILALGLTAYVAIAAADPDAPLRYALILPALLGCGIILGCWLWPAVTLSLQALLFE